MAEPVSMDHAIAGYTDPMPTPEEHLRAWLDGIGLSGDPELEGTPERVTQLFAGFVPGPEPKPSLFEGGSDPVILRQLPFHSLCAHHLLPFFGSATIAYVPAGQVAGLGWFARLLRHHARRPQLQERLGASVADAMVRHLGSSAVVVRLRARQLCVEMRGAESPGEIETLALRGPEAKELLRLA